MFKGLLAKVQSNNEASTIRLRAPIWEQYIRQVEENTFYDQRAGTTFSYHNLSTSFKKFGYAGLTHLNNKHMQACFSQIESQETNEEMTLARSVYFDKEEENSQQTFEVSYLLKIAILLCSHSTIQDQLEEMWLLVNPNLEETVSSEVLLEFFSTLAHIAIIKTIKRIEDLAPLDTVQRALRVQSLVYLTKGKEMTSQFLFNLKADLPDELSFLEFSKVVQSVCMNSSQLRMKITQTKVAQTSKEVVISQVSTLIIGYLTQKEQVLKAQLVCSKWYRSFVPQVMGKFAINFAPWKQKRFRLVFEKVGDEGPLYLALMKDRKTDIREDCGRTYYVSAGNSASYKNFSWKIDKDGILMAADGSNSMLAAHRTFVNDCLGIQGTFVISTNYKGHENLWRLVRVGEIQSRRYVVMISNSKCVKDKVNQIGWAITAQFPQQIPAQSTKLVARDETSRYVYIQQGISEGKSLPALPIWCLELVDD